MPRKKSAEQRDQDHAGQEPQVLDVRADVRADLLDGVRAGVRMTLRGTALGLAAFGLLIGIATAVVVLATR